MTPSLVTHSLSLLCCLLIARSASAKTPPTTEQLPTLWDDAELDAASQSAGLFRILSEVHLSDQDQGQTNWRGSYLLEEWLDGPSQTFRLDVLTRHSEDNHQAQGAGSKKSLLVRGATSERHLLEPFACSPFESLAWALGPQLGSKFPRSGDSLAVAGLGALWLMATRAGAPTFKAALAAPLEGGTLANKRTRARTMRTFDMFEVPAPKPELEFPFKMRLYFLPGEWRKPDGKFNPNALVAVHLVKAGNASSRIVMSARVLEIEVGARSLPGVGAQLFELPLGYGCTRPEELAPGGALAEYRPPRNCLVTSSPRQAQVCQLEVVTYLPVEPTHDLDRWAVHTSSLRLVAGELAGRNYLALETRDFATPQGPVARRSSLRRAKRIWDLGAAAAVGEETLEGGEYSDRYAAPPEGAHGRDQQPPPPMYFELAEHLRVCRAFGNAQLDELPTLEFALSEFASNGSTPTTIKHHLVGLPLVDERSWRKLFHDTQGFHLVRELAAPWSAGGKVREMHHEKRLERLELRDHAGALAWTGPASLVRRWYTRHQAAADERDLHQTTPEPAEARDVRLTIYLFEAPVVANAAPRRQVGRLQLTLSEGQRADEAYLHRELDLEPCLQRRPSDNTHLHTPAMEARDSLAFRLVYPLDEPATQVLALRADYRDAIYGKFLAALASEEFLSIGDQQLLLQQQQQHLEFHVQQLSSVRVDVESNLVQVAGQLHRWPEEFNYVKWPRERLGELLAKGHLGHYLVLAASELKPTSELCAQSCAHYACPVFVFDQIGKRCHLYAHSARRRADEAEAAAQQNSTSASAGTRASPAALAQCDAYCAVYERKASDALRRTATPRQLIGAMRTWLARENGSAGSSESANPLTLELEPLRAGDATAADAQRLVLVPSALHTGSELRAKADQLQLIARAAAAGESEQNSVYDEDEPQVEFELLLMNRKFKAGNFHLATATATTTTSQRGPDYAPQPVADFPLQEAGAVRDQWECELLCREHDCRSFSYCSMSQRCQVSALQARAAIEAASEPGSFCVLLARDLLSKFERLPALLVASSSELERRSAGGGERRRLALDSAHDCAIACVEARDFTCRSFVMCPGSGGQGECHLFGERNAALATLTRWTSSQSLARAPLPPPPSETAQNTTKCDLYRRSYLADYQAAHGKQLRAAQLPREPERQRRPVRLLRGLGAEECASACSHAMDDQDQEGEQASDFCAAFHVCLNSPGQGKRHQLLCGLLMLDHHDQLPSGGKSTNIPLLQDEPNCTAFVPYSSGGVRRNATSDHSRPGGRHADGEPKSTSAPIVSLLVVSMGLATGYALTWLIALQGLVTFPTVLAQSMRS